MPGLEDSKSDSATEVAVPMVHVQLVESTKVLPQQSTAMSVKLNGCRGSNGPWRCSRDGDEVEVELIALHHTGVFLPSDK